eukprot:4744175-Amphidinium_carterae.2
MFQDMRTPLSPSSASKSILNREQKQARMEACLLVVKRLPYSMIFNDDRDAFSMALQQESTLSSASEEALFNHLGSP